VSAVDSCLDVIARRAGREPVIAAVILGTGLGGLAERAADAVALAYADLPGFPRTGVPGHAGRLVIGRIEGVRVALFEGREHTYEHGRPAAMRVPIEVANGLGAGVLVLTNSAGSLDPGAGPGTIMMITDHINLTGYNPLIGETGDERFVDMTTAYDETLRQRLKAAAAARDIPLGEGVYAWFTGPSFETPAEIRAARALGADAVGMSTVPEVIIARRLGLRVAALSMITNRAAGLGPPLDHAETRKVAGEGATRLGALLGQFLRDLAHDPLA
jgi:purine-nucleoside phosphorylase